MIPKYSFGRPLVTPAQSARIPYKQERRRGARRAELAGGRLPAPAVAA